jgi:hypothetical protein
MAEEVSGVGVATQSTADHTEVTPSVVEHTRGCSGAPGHSVVGSAVSEGEHGCQLWLVLGCTGGRGSVRVSVKQQWGRRTERGCS